MRKFAVMLCASAVALGGASPAAAQGYATSVAADGQHVFVGESLNERAPGYVYVYSRDGSGAWSESGRLQASDATVGDHFGRTIARTGNQLLSGATVRGETTGAVYVFTRSTDGSWSETQVLTASDGQPGDAFGRVMAVDGDVALVAAWAHGENRGAVYVFRRDASGNWSEEAKLMPSDLQPEDWFGTGLSVSGELAVIGTSNKNQRTGVAHVYRRSAGGDWTLEGTLEGSGAQRNSQFGMATWTDGGRILVSAPTHNQGRGVVYGFVQDPRTGEWHEAMTLAPFDGGNPGLQFGTQLGMVDGDVWIGAPGANGQAGRVYVYETDESGDFVRASKHAADGVESGDQFGGLFAVSEQLAVVSALGDDHGAGTAIILERTDGGDWRTAARVWTEFAALDPITGSQVDCTEGTASEFGCEEVDILSFLPVQAIGGARGVEVNDIWGWTDPQSGREYALVGRYDGTSFVDVTDPYNPVYVGNLPKTAEARANVWRYIKVYRDHAYIVSDGAGPHGMQVFDLTRLRHFDGEPMEFTVDAHYDQIASAHNIVINEESGFAFAVGSSSGGVTCGGGLHMIDIRQPKQPTFAGCFSDPTTGRSGTGYSHDAQCVTYRGPDSEHQGKEICFGSNETALSIADVSDKANPVALSAAAYPNVGYAHQGWITDDHRYFYMDDELDELRFGDRMTGTRTLIWDITDLDDPVLVNEYFGETLTSDHNLYIVGDYAYLSNYVSGLRILDIRDPTSPVEVAYFDTVPYAEAPGFSGSWSNYPFFGSGTIIVTSGSEGLFMLRHRKPELIP